MSNEREKKYWNGGANPIWLFVTWPMLFLYWIAVLLHFPLQVARFLGDNVHPLAERCFELIWVDLVLALMQKMPWSVNEHALALVVVLGGLYLIVRLSERFALTEDRLLIRTGVLFRSEDEIELYRVMDVRSRRGPLQFLLNVGDVTVMSSDASGTVVLRGVPGASRVRDLIRERTEECKSRRGFRVLE
ncbi:PH domain-containing protein [Roseibium sp. RKSG952]|uniref:PH domain-containing protein n=1 Tax=Roseibium sp. RKSG952 TaxID=2529384 RepID=UPI0012BCD18B|nr:PH domain-containing protein [Roseibium sp. RKSG952]MTH95493.1 PH domain-containing protein [Roseibium sp. RKSG952]